MSKKQVIDAPAHIGLIPLAGRYYPALCRDCGWVGSSEELTEDDAQCTRDIGERLCLGDCDELDREDLLGIIQAMAKQKAEQDALLREVLGFIDDGVGRSNAEWHLIQKVREALSDSTEPSAPEGATHVMELPLTLGPTAKYYRAITDESYEVFDHRVGEWEKVKLEKNLRSCQEYLRPIQAVESAAPVERDIRADAARYRFLRDSPDIVVTDEQYKTHRTLAAGYDFEEAERSYPDSWFQTLKGDDLDAAVDEARGALGRKP